METAMVGRSAELERLLDIATEPSIGAVLLTGPAGVGKSRLAEGLLTALVENRQWGGFGLSATDGGGRIPYASLSELIPDTLDGLDIERAGSELTVLRAVEDALGLHSAQPTVVVIDDIASFDLRSCELFVHLATNRRLFIAASQALDNALPEALRRLTPAGVVEFNVEPLSITGTAELAAIMVGGTAGPGLVRTLQARTGGNPFFIRELTANGLVDGRIIDRRGVKVLSGELAVPPNLGRQIMFRLGLLSTAERDVLELLALAGSLGVDDLGQIVTAEELETMERRGLVTTYTDRRRVRVRLTHPLHAEAIRADMTALVERQRHRRLNGIVERHGARRADDIVLRARSQLSGGLGVEGEALVEAAYTALRFDRVSDAAELSRAAYDADPNEQTRHVWSEALIRQGRFVEADALMATPLPDDADEWQVLRWAIRRSSNQLWGFNDLAEAWRIDEACLERLTEPDARDRVDAHLAWLDYCDGRAGEAIARTDRLSSADPTEVHTHPDVRFAICAARAPALVIAGRVDDGAELAQRAWDSGWGADTDYGSHGQHLIALGFAHLYRGDLTGTRFIVEHAIAYCRDNHEATPLLFFLDLAASAELMAGELLTALSYYEEARLIASDLAIAVSARSALAGAALALAQRGEAERAAATLARLDDMPGAPGPRWGLDIEAAQAWVTARSGDPSEAAERLRAAAAEAHGRELNAVTLFLLFDLTRLGYATSDDAALASSVLDRVQGPLLALLGRAVEVAAGRDGAGLDEVAAGLDEMGFGLWSAEMAAMAADGWVAAGDQRSATKSRRAADRARREVGDEDAIGSPAASAAGLAVVDPLTRREREIATMAAGGERNNDIAERLHVSVRTVETHLSRIYRKLGVGNRNELTAALSAETDRADS